MLNYYHTLQAFEFMQKLVTLQCKWNKKYIDGQSSSKLESIWTKRGQSLVWIQNWTHQSWLSNTRKLNISLTQNQI